MMEGITDIIIGSEEIVERLGNEGHGKKGTECSSLQGYELAKQDQKVDVQQEYVRVAVAMVASQEPDQIKVAKNKNQH